MLWSYTTIVLISLASTSPANMLAVRHDPGPNDLARIHETGQDPDVPDREARSALPLPDPAAGDEGHVSRKVHLKAFDAFIADHDDYCPDISLTYNRKKLYDLLYSSLPHCIILDYSYKLSQDPSGGSDPLMSKPATMLPGTQILRGLFLQERESALSSCSASYHWSHGYLYTSAISVGFYIVVRLLVCMFSPLRK